MFRISDFFHITIFWYNETPAYVKSDSTYLLKDELCAPVTDRVKVTYTSTYCYCINDVVIEDVKNEKKIIVIILLYEKVKEDILYIATILKSTLTKLYFYKKLLRQNVELETVFHAFSGLPILIGLFRRKLI